VPDRPDGTLAAGRYSTWLVDVRRAVGEGAAAAVPCDGCTACCRSSQFVPIAPDETDTLAHIPQELLFPAPRMPGGHVVLGYDERGHCPMLVDDRCSIYHHRPRTCRTYDCRVFTAAGVEPDKAAIAERTRRWRFDYPTDDDRTKAAAVRAAEAYLREHPDAPAGAAERAVFAVEIHDLFVETEVTTGLARVTSDPDPDDVRAALDEYRRRTNPRRG
jgi:Fe-S-cluster containining protein